MEKVSKKIFKEIMTYVKEFETLGNKWCEDDDLGSVAKSRSYAKKIMTAMKPYIETSIKEADLMISTAEQVVPEVVEPVVETVVEPVVEEVKVEEVKVEPKPAKEEVKEVKRGFNFNKSKK